MTTLGTTLVVMERGSAWPSRLHDGLDLIAIQQDSSENEDELLRRTRVRIRTFEATGGTIDRAVLSCNDDAAPATQESRARIARALLEPVARGVDGKLLLLAPDASPAAQEAIFSLTDGLTSTLAGTSACVSALFADEEPSGPVAVRVPAVGSPEFVADGAVRRKHGARRPVTTAA